MSGGGQQTRRLPLGCPEETLGGCPIGLRIEAATHCGPRQVPTSLAQGHQTAREDLLHLGLS